MLKGGTEEEGIWLLEHSNPVHVMPEIHSIPLLVTNREGVVELYEADWIA
jgi:hypothetical protein